MNPIKNTKSTKNSTNKSKKKKPTENKIKQIDINKKPHWYTQYPWSPVPDDAKIFFGREIELMGFWYEMEKLVGRRLGKKSNYAFFGNRELGKTSYLKRCYNIAFWEQDEVVPFYHSFPQYDGNKEFVMQLSDLRKSMPIQFLQQFFSFCTKDETFLILTSVEHIFDYLKKIKFPKLERVIALTKTSLENISNATGPYIMRYIWNLTQSLSFFVEKKCLLIIDEAQEMNMSLYDDDVHHKCKVSISDIIDEDRILLFISSSNVSMLVNDFLDYNTANCFTNKQFMPLKLKDAEKLIHKMCPKGYKELVDDLLKLVGGNPYYIGCILTFNMLYMKEHKKEKDFSSKKGLDKAYNFEVLNLRGRIYNFWNVHIRKYKDYFSEDLKGKKGFSLQLLYQISSNLNTEFTYPELMKEFDVDKDTLVKKLDQLVHANLIEPISISRLAHGFPDLVLPAFLNKFFHQLIIEGPSKNVSKMAKKDYKNLPSTNK